EGRGRILSLLAALHLRHREGKTRDVVEDRLRPRLVRDGERLPGDLVQARPERLLVLLQVGRDGPVLLRDEGPDLVLALADEAERDRLHPTRREPRTDRLPEEGRDLVADDAIEDPARLLGLDLAH